MSSVWTKRVDDLLGVTLASPEFVSLSGADRVTAASEITLHILLNAMSSQVLAGWTASLKQMSESANEDADLAEQYLAAISFWEKYPGVPNVTYKFFRSEPTAGKEFFRPLCDEVYAVAWGPTSGALSRKIMHETFEQVGTRSEDHPFIWAIAQILRQTATYSPKITPELHSMYMVRGSNVLNGRKLDTPPQQGACYIATAVYGSYDAPEVLILRRFRDDILVKTRPGRLFIRGYYALSPRAVRAFGHIQWIRQSVRACLDSFVRYLDRM